MKNKLIILLSTLLLSGCGIFSHQQQTYYVKEDLNKGLLQSEPNLLVQVVPTTAAIHIPLLYYSRKWGGPYAIIFSANTRIDVCTHFLLHSFKFKSDNKLIEEKQFPRPLKLDLCDPKLGFQNNYALYRHQLDDSFQFVKDRKVELEVEFERPDGTGVQTILLRGKGEEKKSKSSLWSVYMGV